MVARQLKNIRLMAMDDALHAMSMSQFIRNYKFLFRTFYTMNKDIMYFDFMRQQALLHIWGVFPVGCSGYKWLVDKLLANVLSLTCLKPFMIRHLIQQ